MALSVIGVMIIGFSLLVGIASKKWFKPDNIIEETAEKIIQEQTGFDIDLSPDTPEKKIDILEENL